MPLNLSNFAAQAERDAVSQDSTPNRQFSGAYLRGQLAVVRNIINCGYAALTSGVAALDGTTGYTSRKQFQMGPVDGADFRLYFANWTISMANAGETTPGNTLTFKAAIEYNGAFYRAYTASGARSAAVDDGGTVELIVDNLEMPANATFWVRVYLSGSGNQPFTDVLGTANDTFVLSTDSVDATGALGSTITGAHGLTQPVAITCVPSAHVPQIGLLGDSILRGTGDSDTNRGYAKFALGTQAVLLDASVPSEAGATLVTSHAKRGRFIAGSDAVLEAQGVNDVNNGATLAQLQATKIALWKLCAQKGSKVFSSTLTPRSDSSDSWATVANQTVHYTGPQEAVRTGVNAWMRDGAPLSIVTGAAAAVGATGNVLRTRVYQNGAWYGSVSPGHWLQGGVYDTCFAVESSLNSGKWVGGGITSDGIHPNSTGVPILANSVPINDLTDAAIGLYS